MGTDVVVGECLVGGPAVVFADDPGDPAAAEFAAVLVDEQRMVVVAGRVEVVFGQVCLQQCDCVVGEGDVAGLAALAGPDGPGGGVQAGVADGEGGPVLGSVAGVVGGRHPGRVA